MLYSFKGNYPSKEIPEKIRLSNGLTRTDPSTFTEEELIDAGYIKVENPPEYDPEYQKLIWAYDKWIIKDITVEEKIKEVTERQEYFFKILIWLVERYERESFLNLPTTDDYLTLQNLAKKILGIKNQENYPFEIQWPVPQNFRSVNENI